MKEDKTTMHAQAQSQAQMKERAAATAQAATTLMKTRKQQALTKTREAPGSPDKIYDKHHEVMRLAILGLKQVEIADKLGMHPSSISRILNTPAARHRLKIMQGARDCAAFEMGSEIKKLAVQAVARLGDVLDKVPTTHQEESNQIRVAQDMMDRAGYGAIKRSEVSATTTTTTLSGEDVLAMMERGRELGFGPQDDDQVQEAEIITADGS